VYAFVAKKVGLKAEFVRLQRCRDQWGLEFSAPELGAPIVVFAHVPPASSQTDRYFLYRARRDGVSASGVAAATAIAHALSRAPVRPPDGAEKPTRRNPVFVSLPSYCDRGCIFCGTNHRRMADPEAFPWPAIAVADIEQGIRPPLDPEWERIQRELRQARATHNTVNWSGNDPLSSPVFDDALRLAHELGYESMSVQAPGTKLADPAYADHLHSLGVRMLSLTCHGPDEKVFDFVGGKRGAFDLFWATVANAERLGWEMTFQVPVVAPNVQHTARTVAKLMPVRNSNITLFFWQPEAEFTDAIEALPLGLDGVVSALETVPASKDERWVTVSGVPACAVPSSLIKRHQWDVDGHHYPDEDRGYGPQCNQCSARDACVGYPSAYWLSYPETQPLAAGDPRNALFRRRRVKV
jgi:hypothetical protein